MRDLENKFWVSIVDYDSFRGIEVDKSLRVYIDLIKEKTKDVIDGIYEDYEEYRDYEVEYGSQARHGSVGTEEIDTLDKLKSYFHWVRGIGEILK